MSCLSLTRVQRLFQLIALITFATYCLNIVAAKAASLAGVSIPLFPDLAEFFLLLVATAAFTVYALCREAMYDSGGAHEDDPNDPTERS